MALLQQDLFCHLSSRFFSRESCFDISTAASMHLAIGSPNIWGRTVQFVRDNVKRILRLLLGSWANLWLWTGPFCNLTSCFGSRENCFDNLKLLFRCTLQYACPANEAERYNLSGTMSSAFWSGYLEVKSFRGLVATASVLALIPERVAVIFLRSALEYSY